MLFNKIKTLFGLILKGLSAGIIFALCGIILVLGISVTIGFNPIVDYVLFVLAFAFGFIILYLLFLKFFKLIKIPAFSFFSVLLSSSIITILLPNARVIVPFILFEMFCGGMLAFAIRKNSFRSIRCFLILTPVILNLLVFYFLLNEGFSSNVPDASEYYIKQNTASLPVENLSNAKIYKVKKLYYGSGNDKTREIYKDSVQIITQLVNAVPVFKGSTSFPDNLLRKFYWGFDASNYPVNGRVYYPDADGIFPLVLIVHGNHIMNASSDAGYEYLANQLAGLGYIAVSIDENFLNISWLGDYAHDEFFVRAWMILKHLENWRKWSTQEDSFFYEKVDMDNIALIGHSRGGAAVAIASVINKHNKYYENANIDFDFNFNIKGIVQLAPANHYRDNTRKNVELNNINCLTLHGGYDTDVSASTGNAIYNKIKFTDNETHFKSFFYIYNANHGQFNTVWGRRDLAFLKGGGMLNLKPIMKKENQEEITKTLVSAFLEISLKNKNEYLPLMKDFRNAGNCFKNEYIINQYEDSEFIYLADYEDDANVETTTLNGCFIEGNNLKTWKEDMLLYHHKTQENTAVYLGWDYSQTDDFQAAYYTIKLGDNALASVKPDTLTNFFFFISNNTDEIAELDFTIEFVGVDFKVSQTFSALRKLPPPMNLKLKKTDFLRMNQGYSQSANMLQFVELPLSEWIDINDKFDPFALTEIRFVFDKTPKGEIVLDKIGFN